MNHYDHLRKFSKFLRSFTFLCGSVFGYYHIIVEHFFFLGKCQGDSMKPILNDKNLILTKKLNPYNLNKGDVVVYRSPCDPEKLVCKKVIHLPHDIIETHIFSGKIPKGYIWLEGENSADSIDSRQYGPVPKGLLLGKGLFLFDEGSILARFLRLLKYEGVVDDPNFFQSEIDDGATVDIVEFVKLYLLKKDNDLVLTINGSILRSSLFQVLRSSKYTKTIVASVTSGYVWTVRKNGRTQIRVGFAVPLAAKKHGDVVTQNSSSLAEIEACKLSNVMLAVLQINYPNKFKVSKFID